MSTQNGLQLATTKEKESWMSAYKKTGSLNFHPLFVWWHSLSHRLITALSIDSGYSSASIRERVYLREDPESGAFYGGVLRYTTQTGGEMGELRWIDCTGSPI